MPSIDEVIADAATALLDRVAAGDAVAEREYDQLLYALLFKLVKQRGALLARQASHLTAAELQVPTVPAADLDSVAHDVTVTALRRARRAAARFDPSRGDGATWAINAAAVAYVDVVRTAYGVRRAGESTLMEPGELETVAGSASSATDPAAAAEVRAALDDALGALTAEERFAVLAHMQSGFSYAEIAYFLFADGTATKRVDRLLQSARRKLHEAQIRWRDQAGTQ